MMLGETGRKIWAAYQGDKLNASDQALVREYCRAADILDGLNDLAAGRRESWVTITFDDMGEVQLNVDRVLDTQVKVQGMLKQLHAEIRQAGLRPAAAVRLPQQDALANVLTLIKGQKEKRESQSG